jgi:hypothetical protein
MFRPSSWLICSDPIILADLQPRPFFPLPVGCQKGSRPSGDSLGDAFPAVCCVNVDLLAVLPRVHATELFGNPLLMARKTGYGFRKMPTR